MFYPNIFDPSLVTSQIFILQCIFYLSNGFWLLMCNNIAGTDLELSYILNANAISFTHWYGWPPVIACLFSAPVW